MNFLPPQASRPPCHFAQAISIFAVAIILSGIGFAGATAQEAPRFIKSGIISPSQWCGNHGLILHEGGMRDALEIIWLDLLTKRQITLLSVPAADKASKHLAMYSVDCSPDGRWLLAKYSPYREGDSSSCETVRNDLPKVVLWDTHESKQYDVGHGYWDFRWAPKESILAYRFEATCNLERDRRTSFRIPARIQAIQTIAARALIRRALGPTNGWIANDHIETLTWLDADHLVVDLLEYPDEGEDVRRQGREPHKARTVKLLITLRKGADPRAEQLHEEPTAPDRVTLKLAVPQISATDSKHLLQRLHCAVGTKDFPDCWYPKIHQEPIKLNISRYCGNLTVGDVQQLCGSISVRQGVTWARLRYQERVLLLRQYYPLSLSPSDPPEKLTDLFLIENDEGGYLK
jgi:hypothetical protein